ASRLIARFTPEVLEGTQGGIGRLNGGNLPLLPKTTAFAISLQAAQIVDSGLLLFGGLAKNRTPATQGGQDTQAGTLHGSSPLVVRFMCPASGRKPQAKIFCRRVCCKGRIVWRFGTPFGVPQGVPPVACRQFLSSLRNSTRPIRTMRALAAQ